MINEPQPSKVPLQYASFSNATSNINITATNDHLIICVPPIDWFGFFSNLALPLLRSMFCTFFIAVAIIVPFINERPAIGFSLIGVVVAAVTAWILVYHLQHMRMPILIEAD